MNRRSLSALPRATVTTLAVGAAGILPVLLMRLTARSPGTHVDLATHAVLEVAGGGMALAVAALLELRTRHGGLSPRTAWIAAALAWMGPMDIVHGVLPFGPAWSWTRHVATFGGGCLCAGIMLGGLTRMRRLMVPLAAAMSAISSVLLVQYAAWLPAPFQPGGYTLGPQLLNGVAGVGFLVAAAALFRAYHSHGTRDDVMLASHTSLFAVSALLFGFSHVWDASWWLWHVCRATAYVIVAADGYLTVRRLFRDLVSTNTTLAERVTERTAALASASDRLRMAVEVAQLGVFQIDPAAHVVETDDRLQRALALPSMQMPLADLLAFVPPADCERVSAAVAAHRRSGVDHLHESFRIVGSDGAERWVDVSARIQYGGAGEWARVEGVAVDATDRHHAEQRREDLLRREQALRAAAEAANRAKDDFLGVLSHELRTPLNAVMGWASMLANGQPMSAAAQVRAASSILRNAKSQAALVDDLLDVTTLVSGQLRIAREPVHVAEVVRAACDTIKPGADAKHLRLTVTTVPGTCVTGDARRLQQMVWNLLSNAVKFTPDGGSIIVDVHSTGTQVRILVRDTGVGIDPAFLPYMFERFTQADASPTRPASGLGIGLALVRYLTELHGGTISGRSAGIGLGAEFEIILPRFG